jgi:hypothetical protein
VLLKALNKVPLPDTVPNGLFGTASVKGNLTGNHFHWDSSVAFGSYSTIAWNGPSPSIRSTTFTLLVEGVTVATNNASYYAY